MPLNSDSITESCKVGFGTASLFRLNSSQQRQKVLAAAWEAGVRHFDTARLYGLGRTENELGRFLRGNRRNQAIVVTKAGLAPGRIAGLLAPIQGAIRPALRFLKRKSHGHQLMAQASREIPRFDLPFLRHSVECSLRQLDTEYIDILLLHEPEPQMLVHHDEILSQLQRWQKDGIIRQWGIAGEPDSCQQIRDLNPLLADVFQVADRTLMGRSVPKPPPKGRLITFGCIGPLAGVRLERGSVSFKLFSSTFHCEPDAAGLVKVAIQAARMANQQGTILIGSTNPSHINEVVKIANNAPPLSSDLIILLQKILRENTFMLDKAST